MQYLQVITLEEAKSYLRIDDTLTEDDKNIERMITAALKYVENATNVLVCARDKTYYPVNGCIRVYDFPINTAIADTDTVYDYPLYRVYMTTEPIILNVGYDETFNVPQDIREAAFELIDIYYYGKETGRTMDDLSPLVKQTLNQNKRFIL